MELVKAAQPALYSGCGRLTQSQRDKARRIYVPNLHSVAFVQKALERPRTLRDGADGTWTARGWNNDSPFFQILQARGESSFFLRHRPQFGDRLAVERNGHVVTFPHFPHEGRELGFRIVQ